MIDLPTAWYLVLGVSILAYMILDGFDLGVGALHLFAKTDEQRRIFLNSIGPVWDGNEVWIVIVMGGLFAGFPNAYATVFSGFYSLFMFLIAGLMFRACAIEFRSKRESVFWRKTWDSVFSFSSIIVAFCIGLLLGNVIEGIPLNESQDYVGDFSLFFRPYSILIAITSVGLCAMHGAIFLVMKTEGDTQQIVIKWINKIILFFISCYFVTSLATLVFNPRMVERFFENPLYFVFPTLALLAIFNVPRLIYKKKEFLAFIFSSISIAFLLLLFSIGTYPVLVYSTINPEINSVTIYNAASSDNTLINLLIVAAIGVPCVLAYGTWIYRVFRGKVKLDKSSY